MLAGVLLRLVPDAGHALARQPLLVLGMEADHRAALGADEIRHRDAHGPAELSRLRDDLIGRVLAARPADLRDRLHLLHGLVELHPDGDRSQVQVLVEAVDDAVPVVGLGAHARLLGDLTAVPTDAWPILSLRRECVNSGAMAEPRSLRVAQIDALDV